MHFTMEPEIEGVKKYLHNLKKGEIVCLVYDYAKRCE